MANQIRWKIAQLAELKWWKNYLEKKDVQEYLDKKAIYWHNIINKCGTELPINEGLSILDAGCGPAGIFMICKQQHVVAFDPLIDDYENNLPHFKKAFYPNVKFEKSTIEKFSSDQQFDIVFCMNAINHVENIENAYDVLCNLVKPGGKLVITIDAHNYQIFKHIFKAIPGDILHPHQYDIDEYGRFLTSHNFQVDKEVLLKKEFWFNHYLQMATKPFI